MREKARLLEFEKREEWVAYAVKYMRNIGTARDCSDGLEVHLISAQGVIGKWQQERVYGFILEARTPERLKLVKPQPLLNG